ncbi:putative dipeptidase [Gracilariopsis chorda]|uniref:Putative dipeptidase n=1 Tax=Gracilariopsis chorda TaxID=448386 RepID=A0A2V3IJN7_9FLOR|nr:putative dipeptidase [Gracilariopsis chorda]|eukprot:PXF41340.1 putative dipeptidase [Gracilariopsis chorda]
MRSSYPHVVVYDRAETWLPSNLQGSPKQIRAWDVSKPIGYIPQVPHTFALFEGGAGYAILNEHGVSVSESTCPARFASLPRSQGGEALFDISAMSRVALERVKTAREAIRIMGDLAFKYGFYGAMWDDDEQKKDEAGEALMVADRKEAWVFHVTPDDTGKSAVWVAQRVPDTDITVVANSFIIRFVESGNDSFMHSENMYDVALRNGLWTQGTKLDFAKVYGKARVPSHSSYSNMRVWRLFTLANPDILGSLDPHPNDWMDGYPFSVTPKHSLTRDDIFRMYRDHFEGTQFDMTQNEAGGPFGDPDRYDTEAHGNMSLARALQGEFGRPVSMFRTSYTTITRSKASLPPEVGSMMYYSQQQPSASVFVPMYVSMSEVPRIYKRGSLFKHDKESMFWTVTAVSNWVHKFYKFAREDLRLLQRSIEEYDVDVVDRKAASLINDGQLQRATYLMDSFTHNISKVSHERYSEFFWYIMAKFHDGYIMHDPEAATVVMKSLFYPEWWLKDVGYFSARETGGSFGATFEPDLKYRRLEQIYEPELPWSLMTFFVGIVIGSFVSMCFAVLGVSAMKTTRRIGYRAIPWTRSQCLMRN